MSEFVFSSLGLRNHITRIFAKLQVETRAQAIVLSQAAGFGHTVQ